MDVASAICEARILYPATGEDCDWYICLSNHRRKLFSDRMQKRAATKQTDKIVVACEDVYERFPGTKLIGTNSTPSSWRPAYRPTPSGSGTRTWVVTRSR